LEGRGDDEVPKRVNAKRNGNILGKRSRNENRSQAIKKRKKK